VPAARGRRLYPRTLRHIMSALAAAGHGRVAIYCDRDNAASIRGIRHAGFSAVAHLRTLVIGERWAVQWRRPGGVRLIAL
jgi:RimJ/RimL family protein N-acetyltransferase